MAPVLVQQPLDEECSFFSLIHQIIPSYRTIFLSENKVGVRNQNS